MDITSYFLALVISKYLRANWLKLTSDELDILKVLEKSILNKNTVR